MMKNIAQFGQVALGRHEQRQDHEAHDEEGDDDEGFFIRWGQVMLPEKCVIERR